MVYGAGLSGLGAKRLLEKIGYEVFLVDDSLAMKSEDALKILGDIEIFVKSPGIPYNKLVKEVLSRGIELVDEIELAYRYLKRANPEIKMVAVTGTNGKTTTTTKIYEMLEYCGERAEFAGNIGKSFAELVCEEINFDFVVLELSSYQLENIKEFRPDVSMIINLTPDHLNRYSSLDEYYDSKFNILKNQGSMDTFILNCNSQEIMKRFRGYPVSSVKVSLEAKDGADYYVEEGQIKRRGIKVLETSKLNLTGRHNQENVLFILATADVLGLSENKVREFLYMTKPLEHRMEKFFQFGKVEFINDSKGTNIDSTIKALEGYDDKIILICGGKDKNLDLSPLVEKIASTSKAVFLIGEISDKLEKSLLDIGYSGEIHNLKLLDNVVKNLESSLNPEESNTVLFSPASSSFDQFKNFEERGKCFKDMVLRTFKK